MAEEPKKSRDFFQWLLEQAVDLIKPALEIFSDPASRSELMASLGLDPPADAPELPATSNLDAYLASQAEEADPLKFAGAVHELTQLVLAMEAYFHGARAFHEGDEERSGSELVAALLNILSLEFFERKAPGFGSAVNLLNIIGPETIAQGGPDLFKSAVNIAEDAGGSFVAGGPIGLIVDLFVGLYDRLVNSTEDEESTESFSDAFLLIVAILLFYLEEYVIKDESFVLRSGYGFEATRSAQTPNADLLTNRTLSFSITVVDEETPTTQATLYNTIVVVPESQGGRAVVVRSLGEVDHTVKLSEDKSLIFNVSGDGTFRIGGGSEADAGKNISFEIAFEHKRKPDNSKVALSDKPLVKFGIGTYRIGFTIRPDDLEIKTKATLLFELGRGGLKFFPFSLMPEKFEKEFPVTFGYSLKRELFFEGNGSPGANSSAPAAEGEEDPGFLENLAITLLNAIDLRIAIHKELGGVIGFKVLHIKTGVQGNFETLSLESSLDFTLKFGSPVMLSINRLGFNLDLKKREDNGGLWGYDWEPRFKPPTGAGIRINTGFLKGGGFLYLDAEKGEYFGSLELNFTGLFVLKAIGIINTKSPDGADGFSLLILITADFPPAQPPMGFTLIGVGGLLGLHRGVNVETLRLGLKTNAINSVLFPEDVIGNIQRIVSDLNQIFPIRKDQFLVGLMAKFGWGAPKLITLEIGIIAEIMRGEDTTLQRLIVLGVLKIVMPKEEADALRIQVNFLGVLDFQNAFVYLEADLYDSHLVGFPLTGSLAFVLSWGEQSVFAVSVGGFHPDFKDYPVVPTLPGAFRQMDRVTIQLLNKDNPKLGIECYFAVTSNSVQFGAKAELLASGPMGFNLYGLLAFDTLIIFDPFSLIINLEATLAIRHGSEVLFGIHFRGKLTGPRPWHVEGEVSFGLFFFSVTIGFSETWGEPPLEVETQTVDLQAMLEQEIRNKRNWRIQSPDFHSLAVTVKKADEGEIPEEAVAGEVVIQPFGELVFSQTAVPLNYTIEKFGNKKPVGADRFSITGVKIETQDPVDPPKARELFAPGHYTRLTDSEKLSRKSFEKMDSGFRLQDSGKLNSAPNHLNPVELDYELDYTMDDHIGMTDDFKLPLTAFQHLSRFAGVSLAAGSWSGKNTSPINGPGKVELENAGFAIASVNDLSDKGNGYRASTQAEAAQYLKQLIAEQPGLARDIQVVESFELAI
ncbi:MAG TPA: hypothetical protein PKB07_11975 [Flavilitoribacter sp.]|nr:hypothetical protein [Flavilitoribacter sp.]